MATISDIVTIARNYLRDFPRFFQVSFDASGRTFELGHPNIDPDSFWAAYYPTGASAPTVLTAANYYLDSRNGMLRLASTPAANTTLMVEGYYYEWFTPSDLEFYAGIAINMHMHNMSVSLENLLPAVADVIGIDAIVEALWALVTEFSRDIDVMTSESIHIPASQRFRMVESLLQFWMAEYEKRAKALNIGLNRIEVFNLRRVSRTTNRLVPIYKPTELGDFGPLERLWIPVDNGEIKIEEGSDDLRTDVFIDGQPPSSYVPNTTAYY